MSLSLSEHIDLLKKRPLPPKLSPKEHFWQLVADYGPGGLGYSRGNTCDEFCYYIGLVKVPKREPDSSTGQL